MLRSTTDLTSKRTPRQCDSVTETHSLFSDGFKIQFPSKGLLIIVGTRSQDGIKQQRKGFQQCVEMNDKKRRLEKIKGYKTLPLPQKDFI